MKKEINSKSRRKWIRGGLAAFASVALLTTGFAVWVVGVTQDKQDNKVNVKVDTAQNANITFTAALDTADSSITLAETEKTTDPNAFVKNTDENVTGDLHVTFSKFEIKYGSESGFDTKYNQVTFSILAAAEGTVDENVTTSHFTKREASSSGWTYIEAPAVIDLTDPDKVDKTAAENVTKLSLKSLTVNFTWGTFFEKAASPAAYYNSKLTNDADKTVSEAENIKTELSEMRDHFGGDAGATIVLRAELTKKN